MAINEQEEFEFRARLEQEQASQKRGLRGGAATADAALISQAPMVPPMGATGISAPPMSQPQGGISLPSIQVPDIVKNAGREVKNMAMGLPAAAMSSFVSPSKTIGNPEQFMGTVKQMGRDMAQEVTDFPTALKERPIQTVSDILSLISVGAKGAQMAGRFAEGAGKVGLAATMGPSVKDITTRLTRNAEVRGAGTSAELADRFAGAMTDFGKEITKASDAALEKLSTSKYMMEGAKAKDSLIAAIKSAKKSLGRGTSDATVAAKNQLTKYATRLKSLRETASESEIGAIIRDLDNDISWNSSVPEVGQAAIKKVRYKIDKMLKDGNPEYKAAMQDVEAKTMAFERAVKQFGLKLEKGVDGKRAYSPTNNTVSSLEGAVNPKKVRSRAVLDRVKAQTGKDFARHAENTKAAAAFDGGHAQGSRRVNLGAIVGGNLSYGLRGILGTGIGGGVAGGAGAMAGGLAGALMDTHGATLSGKFIDAYARMRPGLSRVADLVELAKRRSRRAVPMSMTQHLLSAGAY